MEQKTLSVWLKTGIICIGIIGLAVYGFVLPFVVGQGYFVNSYPEFEYCFAPWVVYISISAIPCYLALISAWKIAKQIERDNSFSHVNAKHMHHISVYSLIDSVYFFVGSLVLLFLNMNHPGFVIGSCMITIIGFIISIASACLARLIEKAAVMKDENDSII